MRLKTIPLMLAAMAGLLAQQNAAEVAGLVEDATQARVERVLITVTQEETGQSRTVHTDRSGAFTVSGLAPGVYSVSASHPGFRTELRRGLQLLVGQNAALAFRLQLDEISTETTVVADADLVELRNSGLSGAMETRAIRELPLNGRDMAQLALLAPGVAPARRTNEAAGPGLKLVVGGSRAGQISFVLDGSDLNDSNNSTPGSVSGVLLGVDTLQEFRVLTNAYSAQYGRSAGGVVNAVSRNGGNELHGTLFSFVRNSAFDAKSFFDSLTAPIPAFRRNQFGGELNGPIVRNRTFFFGSYEGLRQRLGVTNVSTVPDAAARQGMLPGRAPIALNAGVTPYLALLPLPNGRLFADGTGEYRVATSRATDENFYSARLDHQLSPRDSLFVRFTYDRAQVAVPDAILLVSADAASRSRYVTAQHTRVINEQLLNTFRFTNNQSDNRTLNNFLRQPDASLSFIPGRPLGQVTVTGLLSFGPNRSGPNVNEYRLFQFGDDVAWTRGRHSVKLGGDYRFYDLPTSRPQSPYGFYQFNSLADFLQARPVTVELTSASSQLFRHWRQAFYSVYAQDDIRLMRRLTLNLGLRYERITVPVERDGLSANLRDPAKDAAQTVGPMFRNPSNRNIAPRVGFAWDPRGTGRTSVRGGFGVFHDVLWSDFYANPGNRQAPFYTLGSYRNPAFPRADTSAANAANFVLGRQDVVDARPRNPYTMQYNFSVQHQLGSRTVVNANYAGLRGVHLVRFIDRNQATGTILPDGRKFFPVGSTPRNPNFTGIRYKATDGQSVYNSAQLSLDHRLKGGVLARVSYTYSRNIDDGSVATNGQGGDNDLPQDPDSRKAERGLSNYDLRHYLVTFVNWDVPRLPGPRWLGEGWQVNTIATFASGNPFSVLVGFDRARAQFQAGTAPQRPDLAPGRATNPILGGPDRYYDPTAFVLPEAGFYGNLGRNTLIGPGLAMVDVSLNKRIRLTEQVTAQLRAEMFNAPNHPNFSIPASRTVLNASGYVGAAGRITSTQTSARQFQLGLKLSF